MSITGTKSECLDEGSCINQLVVVTKEGVKGVLDQVCAFVGPDMNRIVSLFLEIRVRKKFMHLDLNPIEVIEGSLESSTEQVRAVVTSLMLTVDYMLEAYELCDMALAKKSQCDGMMLITVAWQWIASAELERGNALGLTKGYDIKVSDIANAMKAASETRLDAQHGANRKVKEEMIKKWLRIGESEFEGKKTEFAKAQGLKFTVKTIVNDWLSPSNIALMKSKIDAISENDR